MNPADQFWTFAVLILLAIVGALCIVAAISEGLIRLICWWDVRNEPEWSDADYQRLLAAVVQQAEDDAWADIWAAMEHDEIEVLRADIAAFERGESA